MSAPAKDVTTYSPEELRAIRERFAPLAAAYRQSRAHEGRYVFPAVLLGVAGVLIQPHSALVFLVFWLGMVAAIIQTLREALPLPKCPACHHRLDTLGGQFCPECGSRSLNRPAWYQFWRCSACKLPLTHGKNGRYFRVRACNFCGVMLDEHGL